MNQEKFTNMLIGAINEARGFCLEHGIVELSPLILLRSIARQKQGLGAEIVANLGPRAKTIGPY